MTNGTLETDTGFTPDDETARRFVLLAELPADLGDLLVLEAVHDTVTGGAAQAAAALDAAAGLDAPPDLRFPTTPAGGVPLRTTVYVESAGRRIGPRSRGSPPTPVQPAQPTSTTRCPTRTARTSPGRQATRP